MAKQQNSATIQLPSSKLDRNTAGLSNTIQNHLQIQRAPSKQEVQVADKLHLQMMIQVATAVKQRQGSILIQRIDEQTIQGWADFVDFDRSIRDQPRNLYDQADVEALCQQIRQDEADSQLEIRRQAATVIEAMVGRSVEPEEEKQERRIIEQEPGLWGKLFGGQRITRVVYD